MKTTLLNSVMLYDSIMKLSETPLDFSSAHALVMTKAELEPHVQFFAEQEKAILEKYAEKNEKGEPKRDANGSYTIHSEKLNQFKSERTDLNNVEVEVKVRKLKSLPSEITASALEILLKAFEFPEEEESNG